jgi:hypothetical protein
VVEDPSRELRRDDLEIGRCGTRPPGRSVLQPAGSYVPVEASRFLHLKVDEIHEWLTAEDISREEDWYRRLNEWAMGRYRPA